MPRNTLVLALHLADPRTASMYQVYRSPCPGIGGGGGRAVLGHMDLPCRELPAWNRSISIILAAHESCAALCSYITLTGLRQDGKRTRRI